MAATSYSSHDRGDREIEMAKYFVVKFDADGCLGTVPAKAITTPAPTTLANGDRCTVRWSDRRVYEADVMAIAGKLLVTNRE